uniref:Uncharacterized protein n=1 Tax=Oryza glumipatula TaxID=40148 RepID=A0A0D9Y9A0_9ORYZ
MAVAPLCRRPTGVVRQGRPRAASQRGGPGRRRGEEARGNSATGRVDVVHSGRRLQHGGCRRRRVESHRRRRGGQQKYSNRDSVPHGSIAHRSASTPDSDCVTIAIRSFVSEVPVKCRLD